MPNYIRPDVTGATVFFTVCLADRTSDLLVRRVDVLREAVRVTRQEKPFDILAWVTLPDHLHCIWRLPADDKDFPRRWRSIKSKFSRNLPARPKTRSQAKRGERGVWQRRFWEHHIRNEEDLSTHIRYCWINPMKHRLVQHPADWPYSSFHRDYQSGQVDSEWMTLPIEGDFGE